MTDQSRQSSRARDDGSSVVLLFTGGLKSTVALAMAIEVFDTVACLRFHAGDADEMEAERALAIATWFDVELVTVLADSVTPGEAPAATPRAIDRLAMAARFAEEREIGLVWVAATDHDESGARDLPAIAGVSAQSRVRIGAPLQPLTREAIGSAGLNLGAPVHLTSGCRANSGASCGACGPCHERRRAYRLAAGAAPGPPRLDEGASATTIYLVGMPHSGSTLLSVWLGSHPDITAAGELMSLRSSIDQRTPCTCGMPIIMCEFWAPIVHREPVPELSSIEALDALPFGAEAYLAEAESILARVAAQAGTKFVLDSSKHAMRLELLRSTPRFRVIHLVRDGRAYLDSVRRVENSDRDAESAARQWVSQHDHAASIGAELGDRYAVVRYEDLCTDPEAAIGRILTWLDLDATGLTPCWTEVESHHIHGNPRRFDRKPIRLDESWRTRLASDDVRRFTESAHATLTRYGYSLPSQAASGTGTEREGAHG